MAASSEGPRLDLLFYDWLLELIFRKDRDGEVYPRTKVDIRGSDPFQLTAEMEGDLLDPGHMELRSDLKAVTFHQFALESTGRGGLAGTHRHRHLTP